MDINLVYLITNESSKFQFQFPKNVYFVFTFHLKLISFLFSSHAVPIIPLHHLPLLLVYVNTSHVNNYKPLVHIFTMYNYFSMYPFFNIFFSEDVELDEVRSET